MNLERQLITFLNQSTHFRRFFHLAFTGQLPRYSQTRHADFLTLVEQNREFLAVVHQNLTGSGRLTFHEDIPCSHEDPDFNLLVSGACSCMSEQREFDASIDDLCERLSAILTA